MKPLLCMEVLRYVADEGVPTLMPKPGVIGLPGKSVPGRKVVAEASLRMGRPMLRGMSSPGAEVLTGLSLASSSALATAVARYSVSRRICSSTSGANSQRKIHFPRLTT